MIEPQSAGPDPPGQLFRLWVDFDLYAALGIPEGAPVGLTGSSPAWWQGCGFSGYDEADCLALLRREVFRGGRCRPSVARFRTSTSQPCPTTYGHTLACLFTEACGFRPLTDGRPADPQPSARVTARPGCGAGTRGDGTVALPEPCSRRVAGVGSPAGERAGVPIVRGRPFGIGVLGWCFSVKIG